MVRRNSKEEAASGAEAGAAPQLPQYLDVDLAAYQAMAFEQRVDGIAVVVTSRGVRRRRANREFTRVETVIPIAELGEGIMAIASDPELVVRVRMPVPKPAA